MICLTSMLIPWSIAASPAAEPAPPVLSDELGDTAPTAAKRPALRQATGDQWTSGKLLRNSDDNLNWTQPQPDRNIAANRHPSYLQLLGSPPRTTADPVLRVPSHVAKAVHLDHQLRLTAAQPPDSGAAPRDVFDDVFDDVLPSDALPDPPAQLPDLDQPDEFGTPAPEALELNDRGLNEDDHNLLDDVFGEQPSAPPRVPSTDSSALPPGLTPPPALDEQDRLEPDEPRPLPTRQPAMPPRQPGDAVVDFNGRNCPEELADLQDAWERLRKTPMQEITLDITPSIETNEYLNETGELPRETVKRAPSRVWRNRLGAQLTEGKLEDFRNGKVLVKPIDGPARWLSWYDLSNEDLCFVSAWWGIPSEFNPEVRPYEVRNWTMTTFTWTASALCHKPLYFEEVQLERYGHTAGPVKQTILSGAHFFGNIFLLPYHIGLNPPNECQYALGYYRPGDCAPWMVPAVPLSSRAFRYQMGALASGLTLLP